MNFKPSDFFIGLVEFFSILLPGFCVAYMITQKFLPISNSECTECKLFESNSWIFYAISSYILGHIIYALSSMWRKNSNRWMIKQIYSDKGWFKKQSSGSMILIEQAEIIKDKYFEDQHYHKHIKCYDWVTILISKDNSELITTIKRLEADSKFFRSFTIVCIVAACLHFTCTPILISSIILLLFSLWRSVNRIFNAEEFAALYLINMHTTISEK